MYETEPKKSWMEHTDEQTLKYWLNAAQPKIIPPKAERIALFAYQRSMLLNCATTVTHTRSVYVNKSKSNVLYLKTFYTIAHRKHAQKHRKLYQSKYVLFTYWDYWWWRFACALANERVRAEIEKQRHSNNKRHNGKKFPHLLGETVRPPSANPRIFQHFLLSSFFGSTFLNYFATSKKIVLSKWWKKKIEWRNVAKAFYFN